MRIEEPNRSLKYSTLAHYLRFQRFYPTPNAGKVADDSSKKETALVSVVKWVCKMHAVSESALFKMHCIFPLANVMHWEKLRAISPFEHEHFLLKLKRAWIEITTWYPERDYFHPGEYQKFVLRSSATP